MDWIGKMTIKIIKKEPDKSVVKQVVCKNCGATLEYVPLDVKTQITHDYGGGSDSYRYIDCPNCHNRIELKR